MTYYEATFLIVFAAMGVFAFWPLLNKGESTVNASIIQLDNGRFGLKTDTGVVATYARARDARRGAARAGLNLA